MDVQSDDRLDDKRPEGRTQVSSIFGSDTFLNAFIGALLIFGIVATSIEAIRSRRRNP